MVNDFPSLIFVTGTDGSGKSTITRWLVEKLSVSGVNTTSVWSRFHNYLSKPILALTKISGHNHYENHDGVRFGFHDFERLYGLRYLFAFLQAIDVNIATHKYIQKIRKNYDVVVCERGPWDTLVDVISDTDLTSLAESKLREAFVWQIRTTSIVILIKRAKSNIIDCRAELLHDYKLDKKIDIYNTMAKINDWYIVDNNGTMMDTQNSILDILRKNRFTI